MSIETTENDAEIARILAEEYEAELTSFRRKSLKRSRAVSPISYKKMKINDIEEKFDQCSSNQNDNNRIQIEDDDEIAFILQIEEIVLYENGINKQIVDPTDDQLEKTHAGMTKALQPTNQKDLAVRIFGLFTTIQTRYMNCQTKNQVLIDQIKNLSIQLSPTLLTYKNQGISGITKGTVPTLALGLITDILQGKIEIKDAKEILANVLQIWNDSSIWFEFFEQIVYILVAVTIPSFAQGALGKLLGRVTSN